MALASPQVELLISFFFSNDDVNFLDVSIVLKLHILTPLTRDIFLEERQKPRQQPHR